MHWIALSAPAIEALPGAQSLRCSALGWWALQFTPRVALLGDAVLLEVSGCERLWGGRAALCQRVEHNMPLAGVCMAQAATSFVALALLRLVQHGAAAPTHAALPTRSAAALADGLPLHTLDAARPHLPTLERLGCCCWGDLRALPRAGVARRFGAPLLEALDTAYGQRPERHTWLQSPDAFAQTLELPQLADGSAQLLPAVQHLLGALHTWLQARTQGVLALALVWHLDARRVDGQALPASQELVIRTAQATQDMQHMGRLISERLAPVQLPAPVHSLGLRSLECSSLRLRSASLLPDEQQSGEGLQQLVERLSARLGPQHVLQAVPQADHRPECMTQWHAIAEATRFIVKQPAHKPGIGPSGLHDGPQTGHAAQAQAALTWPTWLLRTPRRLSLRHNRPHYMGPLRLLAGPQRLEAGWWSGAVGERGADSDATATGHPAGDQADALPAALPAALAVRDYFVAHSAQAGLLWIYRERLPQRPVSAHADNEATAASSPATTPGPAPSRAKPPARPPPSPQAQPEPGELRWFLHGIYG